MKWLTEDLPGTGGAYKETAEDFQVDEIPLYPCCGEGEHLYLWIEKVNTSTRELLHQLSRALHLKERDIGYAGLKDSRALTRQMISVPASTHRQVQNLGLKGCRILHTARHTNKLRLGHLSGNRFTITLRNTCPDAAERAKAIIDRLQQIGVPNYFGEQRYGVLGNSAKLGELLLQQRYEEFCTEYIGAPEQIRNPAWKQAATDYRRNDIEAACHVLPEKMRDERRLLRALIKTASHREAVRTLPRNLVRLFVSATQSMLFDQLLEFRLPEINQLQDGDIAIKHTNGACFRVELASSEQERCDLFEISPTAPLFGTKVMLAEGEQGQLERNLLFQNQLSSASWQTEAGLKMSGERRAIRVQLGEVQLLPATGHSLTLSFTLPKGSYATSVLKEIIK